MDTQKNTFDVLAEDRRHLKQAYAYKESGELENALRECEAAIQLVPGWAEAHNLRSIILEDLGRKKEAIAAYREAVRLERKKIARTAFVLILAVLMIVYGIWRIPKEIQDARQRSETWDQSINWPTVMGQVISSRIDSFDCLSEDDVTCYHADVTYEYSVDRKKFQGENLDFGASTSTSRDKAQKISEEYPPGKKIIVHYDPANPENAVLIPGCSGCRRGPDTDVILLGIFWTVIGAGILVVYLIVILNRLAEWVNMRIARSSS